MKKLLRLFLILVISLTLVGCEFKFPSGDKGDNDNPPAIEQNFTISEIRGFKDATIDFKKQEIIVNVKNQEKSFYFDSIIMKGGSLRAYEDKALELELSGKVNLNKEKIICYLVITDDISKKEFVWTLTINSLKDEEKPLYPEELKLKEWQQLYEVGEEFKGGSLIHRLPGTEIQEEVVTITKDMLSGFDTSKSGTFIVIITYNKIKIETTITVKEKPVDPKPIEPTFKEEFKLGTWQVEYKEKEEFIPGTIIHILEGNEYKEEIIPITLDMLIGFDTTTLGKKEVTIKYNSHEFKASINVTAIPLPPTEEVNPNYDPITETVLDYKKVEDLVCTVAAVLSTNTLSGPNYNHIYESTKENKEFINLFLVTLQKTGLTEEKLQTITDIIKNEFIIEYVNSFKNIKKENEPFKNILSEKLRKVYKKILNELNDLQVYMYIPPIFYETFSNNNQLIDFNMTSITFKNVNDSFKTISQNIKNLDERYIDAFQKEYDLITKKTTFLGLMNEKSTRLLASHVKYILLKLLDAKAEDINTIIDFLYDVETFNYREDIELITILKQIKPVINAVNRIINLPKREIFETGVKLLLNSIIGNTDDRIYYNFLASLVDGIFDTATLLNNTINSFNDSEYDKFINLINTYANSEGGFTKEFIAIVVMTGNKLIPEYDKLNKEEQDRIKTFVVKCYESSLFSNKQYDEGLKLLREFAKYDVEKLTDTDYDNLINKFSKFAETLNSCYLHHPNINLIVLQKGEGIDKLIEIINYNTNFQFTKDNFINPNFDDGYHTVYAHGDADNYYMFTYLVLKDEALEDRFILGPNISYENNHQIPIAFQTNSTTLIPTKEEGYSSDYYFDIIYNIFDSKYNVLLWKNINIREYDFTNIVNLDTSKAGMYHSLLKVNDDIAGIIYIPITYYVYEPYKDVVTDITTNIDNINILQGSSCNIGFIIEQMNEGIRFSSEYEDKLVIKFLSGNHEVYEITNDYLVGLDVNKLGKQTVTIKFKDITKEIEVNVYSKEEENIIQEISINNSATFSDKLDPSTLTVNVKTFVLEDLMKMNELIEYAKAENIKYEFSTLTLKEGVNEITFTLTYPNNHQVSTTFTINSIKYNINDVQGFRVIETGLTKVKGENPTDEEILRQYKTFIIYIKDSSLEIDPLDFVKVYQGEITVDYENNQINFKLATYVESVYCEIIGEISNLSFLFNKDLYFKKEPSIRGFVSALHTISFDDSLNGHIELFKDNNAYEIEDFLTKTCKFTIDKVNQKIIITIDKENYKFDYKILKEYDYSFYVWYIEYYNSMPSFEFLETNILYIEKRMHNTNESEFFTYSKFLEAGGMIKQFPNNKYYYYLYFDNENYMEPIEYLNRDKGSDKLIKIDLKDFTYSYNYILVDKEPTFEDLIPYISSIYYYDGRSLKKYQTEEEILNGYKNKEFSVTLNNNHLKIEFPNSNANEVASNDVRYFNYAAKNTDYLVEFNYKVKSIYKKEQFTEKDVTDNIDHISIDNGEIVLTERKQIEAFIKANYKVEFINGFVYFQNDYDSIKGFNAFQLKLNENEQYSINIYNNVIPSEMYNSLEKRDLIKLLSLSVNINNCRIDEYEGLEVLAEIIDIKQINNTNQYYFEIRSDLIPSEKLQEKVILEVVDNASLTNKHLILNNDNDYIYHFNVKDLEQYDLSKLFIVNNYEFTYNSNNYNLYLGDCDLSKFMNVTFDSKDLGENTFHLELFDAKLDITVVIYDDNNGYNHYSYYIDTLEYGYLTNEPTVEEIIKSIHKIQITRYSGTIHYIYNPTIEELNEYEIKYEIISIEDVSYGKIYTFKFYSSTCSLIHKIHVVNIKKASNMTWTVYNQKNSTINTDDMNFKINDDNFIDAIVTAGNEIYINFNYDVTEDIHGFRRHYLDQNEIRELFKISTNRVFFSKKYMSNNIKYYVECEFNGNLIFFNIEVFYPNDVPTTEFSMKLTYTKDSNGKFEFKDEFDIAKIFDDVIVTVQTNHGITYEYTLKQLDKSNNCYVYANNNDSEITLDIRYFNSQSSEFIIPFVSNKTK